MSVIFNYHDDSKDPEWTLLDTLAKTHGIEPEHLLADPKAPMIVPIGPARYLATGDLRRFLHNRASNVLDAKRGAQRRVGDDPALDAFLAGLEGALDRAVPSPEPIAA
jgi:hypothetical protein